MHEVLVNPLGGLSLPRKSVVRLTDRHDMTLDVYRGRKNNTTTKTTIVIMAETHRKKTSQTEYIVGLTNYFFQCIQDCT